MIGFIILGCIFFKVDRNRITIQDSVNKLLVHLRIVVYCKNQNGYCCRKRWSLLLLPDTNREFF